MNSTARVEFLLNFKENFESAFKEKFPKNVVVNVYEEDDMLKFGFHQMTTCGYVNIGNKALNCQLFLSSNCIENIIMDILDGVEYENVGKDSYVSWIK